MHNGKRDKNLNGDVNSNTSQFIMQGGRIMIKFVTGCVFGFFCIVFVLSFNIVYGQDFYRIETSLVYSQLEDEDDFESKEYLLSGTIHFKQVDTGKHPLAEAAFLERVGSLLLGGGIIESDFGKGVKADGTGFGAEVTYAQPDQLVFVNALFITFDSDFDPPVDGEISSDILDFKIGMYLKDGLLVGFEYGHRETDTSIVGILDYKSESDLYGAFTKWVHELENDTAVNVLANLGVDKFDDNTGDGSNIIIEVATDYYFNPRISIGAGLVFNTGDDEYDEGKSFEVRSGIFLNPHFSIEGVFRKFIADNDNVEDEKSIDISLLTRF